MNGLTRGLAHELGAERIRINVVTPGWVMTERQVELWLDAAGEAGQFAGETGAHHLDGRVGEQPLGVIAVRPRRPAAPHLLDVGGQQRRQRVSRLRTDPVD